MDGGSRRSWPSSGLPRLPTGLPRVPSIGEFVPGFEKPASWFGLFVVGRMIAFQLSDRLGKQVVADNQGGAGP